MGLEDNFWYNHLSKENFVRPSESLKKCCSRSLLTKYKEMRGGLRVLHSTVSDPFPLIFSKDIWR